MSYNINRYSDGFTLVELAIVLVIIGLIIGGILVGQDLVANAETRSIISQVGKYNAALSSFRAKFNAIPGDFSQASSYITPDAAATPVTNGDGNGVLYSSAGLPLAAPTVISGATNELSQFWYQLGQLGLIEGTYSGLSAATTLGPTGNFPTSRSNRGGIIAYGFTDALNYYHLGLVNSATSTITTANNLTPNSALLIDSKMDDSQANSGIVQARGGTALETAAIADVLSSASIIGCVVMGSLNIYNTAVTAYTCQLRIKIT
jgi:prepilin-type N-terminal cleavage/methylation domain-containing protein